MPTLILKQQITIRLQALPETVNIPKVINTKAKRISISF